jgi:hypothetical protein
MGCKPVNEKDGLVATRQEAFTAIAQLLADFDGTHGRRKPHRFADTPGKLGIDYEMGKRFLSKSKSRRVGRTGHHGHMTLCRGRIAKFRSRMQRSKQIFGRHAFGKISKVGMLPGLGYGAEIVPFDHATLVALDTACKASLRLAVQFVTDALVWAWLGPKQRPSWVMLAEPILRYARAAWAAWTVSEESFVISTQYCRSWSTSLKLTHLLQVSRLLEQGAYQAGSLADTLSRSLQAFGLSLVGPYRIASSGEHGGTAEAAKVCLDLSRTSPALVKDYFYQLADRMQLAESGGGLFGIKQAAGPSGRRAGTRSLGH